MAPGSGASSREGSVQERVDEPRRAADSPSQTARPGPAQPGPSRREPSRWLARAGGVLFRFRSFTPVPLLLAAVPLLWRSRGAAHSALWVPLGLALCVLGQALRAWVLGQVPDGTSGQNEKLIAEDLNASGPYAHTRNPLYLGNLAITLGLCCVAHDALLLGLVAAAFALQYRAIIAAEEEFLRGRFGARFDAFCASVPRLWPRLRAARVQGAAAPRPFSPRRALRKEHNPAAAWLCLSLLLLALDDAAQTHAPPTAYVAAFAAVVFLWLAVKAWKHRWLSGGFAEDLRRRLRETAR